MRRLPEIRRHAVEELSAGQVECLLLVQEHLTSKEIAARLNISSHTVDQRMRGALKILGVERRTEAAKIVARSKAAVRLFQHQPLAEEPFVERNSAGPGSKSELPRSWSFPFATNERHNNEMSVGLRLLWILLIALGASLSAGLYLGSLESLGRLINRYG